MKKRGIVYFLLAALLLPAVSGIFMWQPANAAPVPSPDEQGYLSFLGDYASKEEYRVDTAAQLCAIAYGASKGYTFRGKTIRLTAVIDMTGQNWHAPFDSAVPFEGTFAGDGYLVRNLTADGALLGYNKGTVSNLSIQITSVGNDCAGVALVNEGNLLNCSVVGTVGTSQTQKCGGIAADNRGTIDNCYSVAAQATAAAGTAGGICAVNSGTVLWCVWDAGTSLPAVGSGTDGTDCTRYIGSETMRIRLNERAAAKGYETWYWDSASRNGGYPIMKAASPVTPLTGIALDTHQITLYMGQTEIWQIGYTCYPAEATDKTLLWESSNEAVVKINQNGRVFAVAPGTAVVRASANGGSCHSECMVTVREGQVEVPCTEILLDRNLYRVLPGETDTITWAVSPEEPTDASVIFSVEDEMIAEVDGSGTIYGYNIGHTVLTVSSADGACRAVALIEVSEEAFSDVWDGGEADAYDGGNGSESDPYRISTPQQLAKLSADVKAGNTYENVYFRQTVGIRLNATDRSDWASRPDTLNSWSPIGTSKYPFRGHYDGGGFSVDGVYIDSQSDGIGLFGYAEDGSISRLSIRQAWIRGADQCGGVVGYAKSALNGCSFSGNLIGKENVGGIVGYSAAAVDSCFFAGIVEGDKTVGGIVGLCERPLCNCESSGKVTGNECVGGIVGSTVCAIENCYGHASVSGNRICGGIVGKTTANVVNCCCFLPPKATDYVGVLAGSATRTLSSYVSDQHFACGNRENADAFLLLSLDDGTFACRSNGDKLTDTLNRFASCIYRDAYYVWEDSNVEGIRLSSAKATYVTVTDPTMVVTLSGTEVRDYPGYEVAEIVDEDRKAVIARINTTEEFSGSGKLSADSVLFAHRVLTKGANKGESLKCRLEMAYDLTSLFDETVTDLYAVLSRVAVVNISGQEMFLYYPESATVTADGHAYGSMRCVSYILNTTSSTRYGEDVARVSFLFSDGKLSLSAAHTGDWVIVRSGSAGNPSALETQPADQVTKENEEEEEKGISETVRRVLWVILGVCLACAAVVVVIVTRSRNNRLYKGEADGANGNTGADGTDHANSGEKR